MADGVNRQQITIKADSCTCNNFKIIADTIIYITTMKPDSDIHFDLGKINVFENPNAIPSVDNQILLPENTKPVNDEPNNNILSMWEKCKK